MTAHLIALSGPLKGSRVDLDQDEIAVGRSKSAQVQIPSLAVSRQHCVIRRHEGTHTIHDLTSYGGTYVNGAHATEQVLAHGDRIGVGDTVLLFDSGQQPAPHDELGIREDDSDLRAQTTTTVPLHQTLFLDQERLTSSLPPGNRVAQHLATLMKIGASVSVIRQPDALQQRLLELVLDVIPAERAAILLASRDSGDLTTTTVLDRRHGPSVPQHISRTITQQVLRDGTAVMSNDVRSAESFHEVDSVNLSGARSVLCVPLETPGRPLGVLYLDTGTIHPGFDGDHLDLASAVASIAAVALDTALRIAWLEEDAQRLRLAANMPGNMIGDSPHMRDVAQRIQRMARSDATVLIRGETGTGKELAARAIHTASARVAGPFVAINCAAIAEGLLESELFGHEKGAFTGAVAQKKGKLELADGGTLFLDEVGDLALSLQAKLLRVLQEREFERVGGTRHVKVDIRLIAATNRHLEDAVRNGTFRQDLYYRLNVLPLVMPPLRDRLQDIPLLASYFTKRSAEKLHRPIAGLSREALECLQAHAWPGNVRELENTIERAIAFGTSDILGREDVLDSLSAASDVVAVPSTRYHDAVRDAKVQVVRNAIAQADGRFTEAAELLGVHPNYLHRLVNSLGLREALKK